MEAAQNAAALLEVDGVKGKARNILRVAIVAVLLAACCLNVVACIGSGFLPAEAAACFPASTGNLEDTAWDMPIHCEITAVCSSTVSKGKWHNGSGQSLRQTPISIMDTSGKKDAGGCAEIPPPSVPESVAAIVSYIHDQDGEKENGYLFL